MAPYMRDYRAWQKEADAIMALPLNKRMMACMDLFSRDFDRIMREGGKRHHALMQRIRAAQ
jgi:hypothetical protein